MNLGWYNKGQQEKLTTYSGGSNCFGMQSARQQEKQFSRNCFGMQRSSVDHKGCILWQVQKSHST